MVQDGKDCKKKNSKLSQVKRNVLIDEMQCGLNLVLNFSLNISTI